MKILLIMTQQVSLESYQIPLGISYIASAIKAAGHELYYFNPNHIEGDIGVNLKSIVNNFNPNVVAIGGMSFHYNQIKRILDFTKSLNSDLITILGGPVLSNMPHEVINNLYSLDIGIIGEGEVTIVEVLSCLQLNEDLSAVPGIIFRDFSNKIIRTDPRLPPEDLDQLCWWDKEGSGLDIYSKMHLPGEFVPGMIKNTSSRVMPLLTSRGCPFQCTFCCYEIDGKRYRQRSLDDVFSEIEYGINKFGINELVIYDDLFCIKRSRLIDFCSRIKKYDIKWQCSFHSNQIDYEIVKLMKESGCQTISIGVESMSNAVLESMQKKTTKEKLSQSLDIIYDNNICIWANLIFGDFAETIITAQESLNWLAQNQKHCLRLANIGYHPGSNIFDKAFNKGLIKDKIKFLESNEPVINGTQMDSTTYTSLRLKIDRYASIFPGFSGRLIEINSITDERVDVVTCCPHCLATNKLKIRVKKDMIPRHCCNSCNHLFVLPMRHHTPISTELNDKMDLIKYMLINNVEEVETIDRLFNECIQKYGNSSSIWLLLVEARDSGNLKYDTNTLNYLETAIALDPYNPKLITEIASRYRHISRNDEAINFELKFKQYSEIGVNSTYWIS